MKENNMPEKIAESIDAAKDICDSDPVENIAEDALVRTSDAEYNVFKEVTKNSTDTTQENLDRMYKITFRFCMIIAVVMFVLLIAGFGPNLFAGIPVSLYGMYGLVLGRMILTPGLGRYSLWLGWKARLLGLVYLLLGVFVITQITQ